MEPAAALVGLRIVIEPGPEDAGQRSTFFPTRG